MMLPELREKVCTSNKMLPQSGLVILTWGNVSAIDRESGLVVIKPSGVNYEKLTPESMVVVDMAGRVVEGAYRPSSDTLTHIEMYKAFSGIGAIVHTHSPWATIWAQMGCDIPALGTTHADDFGAEIPCTRDMTEEEIAESYEKNTGKVICETLAKRDISRYFAVNVKSHGPFVWERDPLKAVEKALVLEQVSMMAWHCRQMQPECSVMSSALMKKHFERKHGANAYYGQG